MTKAVVLMSGGVGSLVAAAVAREQYDIALLHVNWGHRSAEREQSCFERLAASFKLENVRCVDLSLLQTIGGSARLSRRLPIEDAHITDAEARSTPPSFTMGLLPLLIGTAGMWAQSLNAARIILGVSENHGTSSLPISHLYPDYRREFSQAANLALYYGKPRDRELILETPLIELTRAEVIRLGDSMGVPFEHTWSCFASDENACGRCLGCMTRAAGFLQAAIPDPVQPNTLTSATSPAAKASRRTPAEAIR